MPVKVVILGTSNSVMRVGYVSGLARTDGIDIIANTSVGSSHSVMVPLLARDDILAESDFVIVDLTINEQRAFHRRLYNLDTMRDIFLYILEKCRRCAVVPVFLLMPMQLYEDSYAIIAEYKALCERYGVLYFDPSDLIKAEAMRLQKSWQDMFSDLHHLTPEIAEWVGELLGEALKSADVSTRGEIRQACPQFEFVAAAPFAGGLNVIDRSTNLIAASCVHMVPGNRFTMSVAPDAAVVGIALNMSRTNANLRLEGQTRVVKRLNQPYFSLRSTLRLVVWQLITPLQAKNGRIVMTCEADSPKAKVESNDHFAQRTVFPDDPQAEITGLILRRAAPLADIDWKAYAHPALGAG